ncbi:MAG TPA: DUF488 family protein [Acidimicrobiales bacterium]|nr:DUF488 family protein [Acidimicrobiales bacterium]
MAKTRLGDADYRRLLTLRTGLRRFLRWSEERAHEAGLTPAQHQLLLAVRGHQGTQPPTIGDVAESLLLRHHSAVELVDRAEAAGLVERRRDPSDGRVVRLELTRTGRAALERLSSLHLEELRRLAESFRPLWEGITVPTAGTDDGSQPEVRVGHVLAPPSGGGTRVLVDPTWPRGLRREQAPIDRWLPEVAPSAAIRRLDDGTPQAFASFARRYREELRAQSGALLEELRLLAHSGGLVLLTASHDLERSGASVLAGELRAGRPPRTRARTPAR